MKITDGHNPVQLTCPSCGSSGNIGANGAFESKGRQGNDTIVRCLRCDAGIRIKNPTRAMKSGKAKGEHIPNTEWWKLPEETDEAMIDWIRGYDDDYLQWKLQLHTEKGVLENPRYDRDRFFESCEVVRRGIERGDLPLSRAAELPEAFRPAPAPLDPPNATDSTVVESLRQLKALHDEGILTDDEYETKRKALTDQL